MLRSRFFPSLILLSLCLAKLIYGQHGYNDGLGGDDSQHGDRDGDGGRVDSTPTTSSASPTSTTSTNGTASNASGLKGDSQCPGSRLMCITATVNGSIITYELQSQNSQMAWMAIGFGNQMTGSPMVIMWPNADNTITLSQRQAAGEIMPTPVPSPPRVATVATPLSTLSGATPKLTFTIDSSNTQSSHIYAFGTVKPSADPNSELQQHLESGTVSLDLSKTIPTNSDGSLPSPPSSSGSLDVPLLPYQRTIIAHAIVATIGFLFLLPLGALLPRYTRTYSSKWFTSHWVLQGPLGGIVVIVGCILGFVATNQHGVESHTRHKALGKVLLALYLVQAALGILIHFIKISFRFGRPPQNYVHAVLGLTTIALALYQVRLGYSQEWNTATARGSLSSSVNIVWMVWVILLPVLYFGGLAYLPRQLRQEKESKTAQQNRAADIEYKLGRRPS